MSAYAYRIVNVFTQRRVPLSGNPLCVFERAQTLDAARMQALALQFNLSETTFILPSERASARVRIFTPSYEMSGAGLLARFFFPHGGTALEDPATGSATANLGGWCLAMARALPCEFEISQGEYIGRPSSLRLRVDAERQIFVSGDVIELGRGTINL